MLAMRFQHERDLAQRSEPPASTLGFSPWPSSSSEFIRLVRVMTLKVIVPGKVGAIREVPRGSNEIQLKLRHGFSSEFISGAKLGVIPDTLNLRQRG